MHGIGDTFSVCSIHVPSLLHYCTQLLMRCVLHWCSEFGMHGVKNPAVDILTVLEYAQPLMGIDADCHLTLMHTMTSILQCRYDRRILLPCPPTIITTTYTHAPACHFRHSFQTLRRMDTHGSSSFGEQQLRYVRMKKLCIAGMLPALTYISK